MPLQFAGIIQSIMTNFTKGITDKFSSTMEMKIKKKRKRRKSCRKKRKLIRVTSKKNLPKVLYLLLSKDWLS